MAMTEALLLSWLKQPGDTVAEGEPIAEIETDKATMDLESPASGLLGRHLFDAGALVPIASPVCRILEAGEIELDEASPDVVPDVVPGDNASVADAGASTTSTAEPVAFEGIYDELHPVETLAPSVFDTPAATAAAHTAPAATAAAHTAPANAAPANAARPNTAQTADGHRAPHAMSPRQRRLAREAAVAGAAPLGGTTVPGGTAATAVSSVAGRRREAIAVRVSEAWRTIPHFAVSRDIDGSAAVAALKALRGERPDATMTDLLLHAFAAAAEWLSATTGFTAGPGSTGSDVGLAVATPDGVMIPVVTGAAQLSPSGLIAARQDATRRGRDGHLSKTDVTSTPVGSLSNLGALGVDSFTGIIPLGQLCLLTIGRIAPRLVPTDSGISTAQILQATLNVDHRAIDGDVAARALDVFAQALGSVQTWVNGGSK
jgi:pyruvate dehydrogenase E2 component (dihydrolipoamide acetyltransferase)